MKQQILEHKETLAKFTEDVASSFDAIMGKVTTIDFAQIVSGEDLPLTDQLEELSERDLLEELPCIDIIHSRSGRVYNVYVLQIDSKRIKVTSSESAMSFTASFSDISSLEDKVSLLDRCVKALEGVLD